MAVPARAFPTSGPARRGTLGLRGSIRGALHPKPRAGATQAGALTPSDRAASAIRGQSAAAAGADASPAESNPSTPAIAVAVVRELTVEAGE
jgi:hypothetical protein